MCTFVCLGHNYSHINSDHHSSNHGVSPLPLCYWQHESCFKLVAQSKLRHTQPELNRKRVIALSILVVCLDSLDRCSSSQIATAPVGTRFYEATHPLDNHHRGALKDFLWQMDPIMFLPFKEHMSLSSTCDAYSCSKKYQVCKWHLHALFVLFFGRFSY